MTKKLRFCGAFLVLLAMAGSPASASTDYGPAIWRPSPSGHWYTGGYGHRFYVIHDMEGYYLSTISYLQKASTQVSVHYCVNGKKDYSSDAPAGEITQMVRDAYYAWHAVCWNTYSMGTEHEGFVSNPAWFTEALYQASGDCVRAKCNKYNIPKTRNHIIAHGQKQYSWWVSWMRSQGYSDSFITCNSHTDPGSHWDWAHFMDIVNGVASAPSRPTSLTATAVAWDRIDLKWQDNSSGENGFEIQRSKDSSDGPWNTIHKNGENDHSYSSTGLSGNNKYWFRVRAYNAAGNSDWSNVDAATTYSKYPPADPTGLTATAANDDKINLAWTDNANNEDNYILQRSLNAGTWNVIATLNPDAHSYSDTGLAGNRTYNYRVKAVNEAGSSAWISASDTTGPTAPTNLVARAGRAYNVINLTWEDRSGAEAGFKIERATSAGGPFTQIATNAASDATYTDSGLAASTSYYYRVRAYNANANSMFSNTDSASTGAEPPTLASVGNKTVATGAALTFTATSTDPNKTVTTNWNLGFESYAHNTSDGTVLFHSPDHNNVTSGFIDTTATNYTKVVTSGPTGNGSSKVLKCQWNFKTGQTNPYLMVGTHNTANEPNPAVNLEELVSFKVYSSKPIQLGMGVRETFNDVLNGNDGGTAGPVEWVGITNTTSTGSPQPVRAIPANTWKTVTFNVPFEACVPNTADANGMVDTWTSTNGVKGTLQHMAIVPTGTMGTYTLYFDDFVCVISNRLTFSLDAGAPANAFINPKTGKFSWTPSAGQVGTHSITIRVTDQLGLQDSQTVKVTVTSPTGNAAPVISAIGNKTVNEGSALTFTAAATDPDAGQTKAFSLDSGAPSGASIDASTGVFSWTPTEAQGPGSYPITVRVTDNGSPVSNDFETITVTVNEVNTRPVFGTVNDQTINEGQTFSCTVSATDDDLPANTLTYSLLSAPTGMTIDTNTGAISWSTSEATGPDVVQVTVRASDNGSPRLTADKSFTLTINEVNIAPVLTVSNAVSTATVLNDFEQFTDDAYNGTIMFRQPLYSGTTSAFLDAATANTTVITTNSPGTVRSSVLKASFGFKTGQTDAWLRLTTAGLADDTYALQNTTIDFGKHIKVDVYCDKPIKICLGARETGTQNPIGTDGGLTGAIEFVGATGVSGSAPICTRTIAANTWTTLDFDMPNEPAAAFTGNGVLAPGKGVLECLAIVPNGGTGVHSLYLDNFVIYSSSTNMTVNTGEEITLNCFATDADLPRQNLTFSLDAGAPTNATINDLTGVFSWIPAPEQSPSTNVIAIRVTDNGSPALSAVQNVTVKVAKVNTPPLLARPSDTFIEKNSSVSLVITNEATDDDLPANALTYSLVGSVPVGASIDANTGVFTWTPPSTQVTNYVITVRVTDNGVPPLYTEQQFTVAIVPVNTAPSLNLGTARIEEMFANYESFGNNTANGAVMFRSPNASTTTSAFIDTPTNYTRITNSIPAGNPNGTGNRALVAKWNFKTGTANYWLRLFTSGVSNLASPTIDFNGRVKFDVYSTKAIKLAIGVRETGTTAEIGADGGAGTLPIEWIGVTGTNGTAPVCTRSIAASNWTTVEFNLRSEPTCPFANAANGVLTNQPKGTLEHLAVVGNGGTGAYTLYLDNFSVVTTSTLPATLRMKSGSTLSFTATGADPNPGSGLDFGVDADFLEAHTNAVMNPTNGVFVWTPTPADAGTTNAITVAVEDNPTNGGIVKTASSTFSIIVDADALGAQSTSSGILAGESITLSWDSVPGVAYTVQAKAALTDDWTDLETITATETQTTVSVVNDGQEHLLRVIQVQSDITDR